MLESHVSLPMKDFVKLWLITFAVFIVIVELGKLLSLPRTVVYVAAAFYGITYHMPKLKQIRIRLTPPDAGGS